MLKKLLFILTLIALTPTSALAEMQGYLGSDGYFHIKGLQANTKYTIDLGGMPIIKSAISNSCGILRIATSGTIKASDRIEIKDEKSGSTYGFTNTNLPIKETAKCDGTVKSEREIWADDKGTTYISGLSPSSAQTIRLLTSAPTRNIKANICGFLSFKLGEPRPKAIIIENQAFVLASAQSSGGIACRKGKLFVAYPAPILVAAVSAVTWRSQNPVSFSSNTQIASIGGSGGTSWSPPPNPNPNPNPGPGDACTVGVNCDPPPPRPQTCPEGTTGTPPNCEAPPPPPPPPPPPVEPPVEPLKKPTPVSGKMCRVGSQVVAMVPSGSSGTYKLYTDFYRSSESNNPDSEGRLIFNNLVFNDNTKSDYDDVPGTIELRKVLNEGTSNDQFDDEFQTLGYGYAVTIPVLAPCKT